MSTAVGVAGDVASGASGPYLAWIASQASTASAADSHRRRRRTAVDGKEIAEPPRSFQLASASGKAASYADDFKALSGTAEFGNPNSSPGLVWGSPL